MMDSSDILESREMDDESNASEEEEITAQKVLENLENAWTNEMFAPEILPHQTDMVDLMLSQISYMEDNLKDLNNYDFQFVVHKMELERIRYIVASYLRCRLQKIEKYTRHILAEEDAREPKEKRLSEEETKFAQEHLEYTEKYFHQVALQYMPVVQRSDAQQRTIRPNLMSHVFIQANVTVPDIILGADDDMIDLTAGSQHIVPYHLVSDLILKNKAKLI